MRSGLKSYIIRIKALLGKRILTDPSGPGLATLTTYHYETFIGESPLHENETIALLFICYI